MKEFESVTEETLVDPKELNQLIARLSNPTPGRVNGGVSVKDVAETLEIPESDVVRELELLRESKKVHPVPAEAEKLANMLDAFKSTDFQPITNRPLKRVTVMGLVAIFAMFGLIAFIIYSLIYAPIVSPPKAAPPEISKDQPAHVAP